MSAQAAAASGQFGSLVSTKMVFTNEMDVCETCRKIDFQDLIENPRPHRLQGEPSPYIIRYSDDCKLCRLIFRHVHPDDMDTIFELRSYQDTKTLSRTLGASLGAQNSVLLRLYAQSSPEPFIFDLGQTTNTFCARASNHSQGVYCAQPVQDIWHCAKARLWLDTCAKCHEAFCKQEILRVTGMNLIDCGDMVIVQATPEMRWLALSYVWGTYSQTQDHSGYRAGSSISLDIPATISDAIRVTLQLGYRYLWVDEYCIDQNDDSHRNDQIKRMDQIYRGADLTIVAAAGNNKSYGLPGVGSTKRKERGAICVDDVVVFTNGPNPDLEIFRSTWFSRAWTFQEGALSKRLLVFTEHQMKFYCQTSSWTEGFGNPDPDPSVQPDKVQARDHLFDLVDLTSPRWGRESLECMLQGYSRRRTTKEADVLDAFAGVINDIRRSHPTIHLLRGLPCYATAEEIAKDKLANSLEDLVTSALSWNSWSHVDSCRRRPMFPSWTWAGWSEEVNISWLRPHGRPSGWRCYLQHVQLESSIDHIVMPSTLDENRIQQEFDTVTLIQFEAAMIPAASLRASVDTGTYTAIFHGLWAPGHVSTYDCLVENERRGTWSCFVLCAQKFLEDSPARLMLVLVVGWKADQVTAERIGAFFVKIADMDDGEVERLEKSWTWRRVRLI